MFFFLNLNLKSFEYSFFNCEIFQLKISAGSKDVHRKNGATMVMLRLRIPRFGLEIHNLVKNMINFLLLFFIYSLIYDLVILSTSGNRRNDVPRASGGLETTENWDDEDDSFNNTPQIPVTSQFGMYKMNNLKICNFFSSILIAIFVYSIFCRKQKH